VQAGRRDQAFMFSYCRAWWASSAVTASGVYDHSKRSRVHYCYRSILEAQRVRMKPGCSTEVSIGRPCCDFARATPCKGKQATTSRARTMSIAAFALVLSTFMKGTCEKRPSMNAVTNSSASLGTPKACACLIHSGCSASHEGIGGD